MKRRILPLILILALAISLIPSAALADTEHWAADYIADAPWVWDNGTNLPALWFVTPGN